MSSTCHAAWTPVSLSQTSEMQKFTWPFKSKAEPFTAGLVHRHDAAPWGRHIWWRHQMYSSKEPSCSCAFFLSLNSDWCDNCCGGPFQIQCLMWLGVGGGTLVVQAAIMSSDIPVPVMNHESCCMLSYKSTLIQLKNALPGKSIPVSWCVCVWGVFMCGERDGL